MKRYILLIALAGALKQTTAVAACLSDTITPRDSMFNIMLKEVVKVERTNNKLKSALMGVTMLDQTSIRNVPTLFGEADLIKALQLQPGVSAGVEGFAGMMVRGGNADENMFLIDGNPLYQMNHLGGLFSAYNIEAVDNLAFYKSSFPARYGGRLSSVVDITSKSGDFEKYKGNFTIGLTSAKLSFSGPLIKDKTSFAVAVRRSWFELVSIPAIALINRHKKKSGNKVIAGYNFTDFNLKVDQRLGRMGTLSLLGYYGYDHLKTGEHEFSTDKGEDAIPYLHKDENKLGWGNLLGALKWLLPVNEHLTYTLHTSFTRYQSDYNQLSEITQGKETDRDYRHTYSHKDVINSIKDINVNTSLLYQPSEAISLRAGTGYIHHAFSPEKTQRTFSENLTDNAPEGHNVQADEANAYLEGDFQVWDRLHFNAGMRSSLFHVEGKTYATLEPRLSANFILSPTVSLKAGYARMSQFVQQVSDNYISLPTDYWMPITKRFAPLTSDQISAGVYFSLQHTYIISIEGWYKKMHNLLEYKDNYKLIPSATAWEDKLTSGKGDTYGIDIQLEKNIGRLSGFVGYGLMWSNRLFAQLNGGRQFPSKYDNRHKLNISLNYSLSKRVTLNAGWTYMTGNRATIALENYQYPTGFPSTMVPSYPKGNDETIPAYYEGKNNVRLPAYHRLDLGINIYRPRSDGRMGIWNISVYNAYSRMNPIMIRKDDSVQTMDGTALPLRFRQFSLFPIIPSVSYTYKF